MSNSRNWVAQKDCPYNAGSVDILTGATPENPGNATFIQAFGAGPIEVHWSLEDANDPPRKMAGKGSLSGGSIDVSSPSSTFDGTTYDNAPSTVITLTSPVIIRCTLNASEFDKLISSVPEVLTAKMLDGYLERQNVQTGLTGGGAFEIDIDDGTTHYVDLAGNMGTFTIADILSGAMTDDDGTASMTLFFKTGGNSFTTDPNVVWVGGSAPSWSASEWDIISLFKQRNSTKWVALHGGSVAAIS